MLKRFFVSLLGTIAGIWIAGILLFFGLIMIIAVMTPSEEGIKQHSVLCLDLEGEIEETQKNGTFEDFVRGEISTSSNLRSMINALEKAAKDDRIDGVVLNCKGASMGYATCQELSEAINAFKKKSGGKWVYAYSDSYSQGDYIVATTADSVFLNPMGSVDVHGIASQIPFFKGLLDKVGVKMQIVKVGTFKSAVEPFILTSASEPSKLQTQTFVDSIWGYMGNHIAENRKLAPAVVDSLATEFFGSRPASQAKEAGLVDELAYRRIFENKLRSLTGKDQTEEISFVSPEQLLGENNVETSLVVAAFSSDKKGKEKKISGLNNHIAVLYATGDITDESGDGIVGSKMVPQIISLADDENVKGLIMRVNSGGGSAFASEQIWEALEYFKSKGKPFYVSMGDYAASGGYYISCGANKIFADFTTLTGSIGVFGMIPDASELINDKLGVNFSVIESNPNALPVGFTSPLTPQQQASLQSHVEQIYETFVGRVSTGRNLPVERVKEIAEGRVWVGASALELGLVDKLGSLTSAIEAMRTDHFDSDMKVVYYPEVVDDFWTLLARSGSIKSLTQSFSTQSQTEELDAATRELLAYLTRLRTVAPVQARMELMYLK